MGKEHGPWVRHDWCPRCNKATEQTRWHFRLFGAPADSGQHRIQCNECRNELTPGGRHSASQSA